MIEAAAPGPAEPPVPARRLSELACACAVSLALHAAALVLILPDASNDFGAGVAAVDAIGVEIVTSDAIATLTLGLKGSPGPPPDAEAPPSEAAPSPAEAIPKVTDVPPEAVHAPPSANEPVDPEVADSQPEPPHPAAPPTPVPSATDVASDPHVGEPARSLVVPPSSTAVARYAVAVRQVLARVPVARKGRRGRVVVEFEVDEGGRVLLVRVRETSGHVEVDSAIATAVAAAQFPAPPPGMTTLQRTYIIPFEFR